MISPSALLLFLLLAVPVVGRGCAPHPGGGPLPPAARAASGVTVRAARHGEAVVRVIEVDLTRPRIRVEIAAEEIALRRGLVTGRARTLPEWLAATGAVAGVNGGFFGETLPSGHKEVVGLLKLNGRVRRAAPAYRQGGSHVARSALGFTARGVPRIGWVTGGRDDVQVLLRHPRPGTGRGLPWDVEQALACGPRLVREGKVAVAHREERLASPGALPRTFVGYGGRRGRPERLLLCAADRMEFADCARFLDGYFRRQGMACAEGMALDGGGSTQAAWREGSEVRSELFSVTTVPTAVLVFQH